MDRTRQLARKTTEAVAGRDDGISATEVKPVIEAVNSDSDEESTSGDEESDGSGGVWGEAKTQVCAVVVEVMVVMVMVVVVWGLDRCNAGMNHAQFIPRAKAGRSARHAQFMARAARANAGPHAHPIPAKDVVAGPSADPISTKKQELVKPRSQLFIITTRALRTTKTITQRRNIRRMMTFLTLPIHLIHLTRRTCLTMTIRVLTTRRRILQRAILPPRIVQWSRGS
jgi:hypothetical protein